MSVYVLDRRKKPLDPCCEKRARQLLEKGRARVHKLVPFVIRLIDRTVEDSVVHPLTVKVDPGSKGTGIALVRQDDAGATEVVNLVELQHRGKLISDRLTARASFRRRRRGNLRYRPARFLNRTRPEGWLAPSLRHRVDTTVSTVDRLRRYAPIKDAAVELVRFDMQLMQDPEISGVEYQQGELQGYEVREYLLEKFDRTCVYCDCRNVPLQVDHVVPRSKGGSNRVSNLTLACEPCNKKKGSRDVREFLSHDPVRLEKILGRCKAPLRDAAAVNATRIALIRDLRATGLPVSAFSGGRTKWNRTRLDVPKSHALDAACVGKVETLAGWRVPTLVLKATGRGSYCRTRLDRFGFPRGILMRQKSVHGFTTGDLVRADVPSGKKQGVHVGRVAVRASGKFNLATESGIVQGLAHRHCHVLQRGGGYAVSRFPSPDVEPKKGAFFSLT